MKNKLNSFLEGIKNLWEGNIVRSTIFFTFIFVLLGFLLFCLYPKLQDFNSYLSVQLKECCNDQYMKIHSAIQPNAPSLTSFIVMAYTVGSVILITAHERLLSEINPYTLSKSTDTKFLACILFGFIIMSLYAHLTSLYALEVLCVVSSLFFSLALVASIYLFHNPNRIAEVSTKNLIQVGNIRFGKILRDKIRHGMIEFRKSLRDKIRHGMIEFRKSLRDKIRLDKIKLEKIYLDKIQHDMIRVGKILCDKIRLGKMQLDKIRHGMIQHKKNLRDKIRLGKTKLYKIRDTQQFAWKQIIIEACRWNALFTNTKNSTFTIMEKADHQALVIKKLKKINKYGNDLLPFIIGFFVVNPYSKVKSKDQKMYISLLVRELVTHEEFEKANYYKHILGGIMVGYIIHKVIINHYKNISNKNYLILYDNRKEESDKLVELVKACFSEFCSMVCENDRKKSPEDNVKRFTLILNECTSIWLSIIIIFSLVMKKDEVKKKWADFYGDYVPRRYYVEKVNYKTSHYYSVDNEKWVVNGTLDLWDKLMITEQFMPVNDIGRMEWSSGDIKFEAFEAN